MSLLEQIEAAAKDPEHEDHEEAKAYLARRDSRTKQRARMGLAAQTSGQFRMSGNTLVLDMLVQSAPTFGRGGFS